MSDSQTTNEQQDTTQHGWYDVMPFFAGFALVPVLLTTTYLGGWWILLTPFIAWFAFSSIDFIFARNQANLDPNTDERLLSRYQIITLIWTPMQFLMIFGMIAYVTSVNHLTHWEKLGVFLGVGVISGALGINFSHEMMHQRNRVERGAADLLLAMVLYSHFRSEHLLVHHRFVATPHDTVTARYNEGFHRFFIRVLPGGLRSAWRAERQKLARRNDPWWHKANPFYLYALLQFFFVTLAYVVGGQAGVGLFLFQSFVAIWHLELVNYVEHYGLTRKHLGDGRYEHVKPHHSWNADHRLTNYVLINLQRHSDHHYKPDRRFPLLQTYSQSDAPQLPFSYGLMTAIAMVPPVWRRMMNPRVRAWRKSYYPEITDWRPYNLASHPVQSAC